MESDLEKIAIVGMACRLPQAESVEAYWQNLLAGNICTQQKRKWPDGIEAVGGFLNNIDTFDADFFNTSPHEAVAMDPQLRQLLEVSYQAIDRSGLSIEQLRQLNTGIFTSSLPGDYKNLLARDDTFVASPYSFFGNAPSGLSGRLSYFYNINGPSVTVDTACSSGLTALYLARLALLNGDCEAALVGAATLFATSEFYQLAQKSQMLSKSNQCATFDEQADGFVPAEGVVVLVLTSYKIASERQLPVYSLIESLKLNHNGLSNGLMAPSVKQQRNLIASCYQRHHLDQLALIEAHGTGTKLGDPIELRGLEEAFAQYPIKTGCYLGASKMVIGHTLVSSSLASLIKLLFAYEYQIIPPNPLFKNTNSLTIIPSFLTINQQSVPWPADKPYAGISAFGFTGSNAHLILKNLTKKELSIRHKFENYFIFSAKNQEKLYEILSDIKQWLQLDNDLQFSHLSTRLIKRAQHFSYRFALYAKNYEDLILSLERILEEKFPCHGQLMKLDGDRKLQRMIDVPDKFIKQWLQGEEFVFDQHQLPLPFQGLPYYPFTKKHYWVPPLNQYVEAKKIKSLIRNQEGMPREEGIVNDGVLSIMIKGLERLLNYREKDIDPEQSLLELGVDSLTAMQLINYLKENNVLADINLLWEATSLHEFASTLTSTNAKQSIPPWFNDAIFARLNLIYVTSKSMTWAVSQNSGAPLLLLPPLNCNYQVWLRQINVFQQQGYQVHIPHYPGHYPQAKLIQAFGLEVIADEIKDYALYLSDRPHCVAWSLGGVLGLLAAIQNQNCFKSMILVACAAYFDSHLFEKTIEMQKELAEVEHFLKIVFQTESPINEIISAQTPMPVLKDYYQALMALSLSQKQIQSITIPTQLVYGQNDPVICLKEMDFLRHIPEALFEAYHDAGHFIPLTHARTFNQQCMSFIHDVEKEISHAAL